MKATNNAGLWQNLAHSLPNNASITKRFRRVLAILSAIILHIAPIFLYKSASLTWCRQKAQKTEENTGAGVKAMSSGANFENPQPETVGSPTDRVFEG